MSSDDDATGERTEVAVGTIDERVLKEKERTEPGPGTLVADRYRVVRRIGKGGMGEVMAARDEQIGRDVAIKRMRAAAPSERAIKRFMREASIQGRLEHPAIVPVHEIGHDTDGLPFFAMKKLTGTTLAKILADKDDKAFPRQRVLRAFAEVCLAVELAHVRGVVHRDLKPDNIMLGDFGEVYVLDWGVAKVIGEDDGEFADIDSSGGSGEHATAAGTTIGTPGYMSPEQVRGTADIDGRADVYTLGCLLYEILAGEALHPRGYEGLQSAIIGRDARPSGCPGARDVPPELDALCVQATATEREVRVQTARELGDRVQRFLDGDRDLAMRRGLAREHLERARTAFVAGSTDEQRSSAMREAASALALDPKLAGAAELVGRLMLEPPHTTPSEVEEAIVADDVRTARLNAQGGALAVVGGTLFTLLMWWVSPGAYPYFIALLVMLLVNGAISYHNLKTPKPNMAVVVIGNALLVMLVARMFSPILIAPGVAAVLAMSMVVTPRFSRYGSGAMVAALMIGAILVPLVLERIGVLSVTLTVSDQGQLFSPPGLTGAGELPILIVGGIYFVGLILGAVLMANAVRSRTSSAHRHLHLQAWQLRQLVPRTG